MRAEAGQSKARVLFVTQFFNTPEMTGSIRTFETMRRLAECGFQIHVVTTDPTGKGTTRKTKESPRAGIQITRIPVPYDNAYSYPARIRAFIRFSWRATLEALRERFDVLLVGSPPLTVALPGIVLRALRRKPIVLEVRDLWPELPITMKALRSPLLILMARALESVSYRSASEIIALSEGMAHGVRARAPSGARITVIPGGSDVDFFRVNGEEAEAFRSRFDWLGDRPLVLYVGTFGRIYGVPYLVDIAEEMVKIDRDVRFLIVGSGHDDELIRARASEAGLLDRTVFVWKRIKKSEVPTLYAAADMGTSVFIDVPEMWNNSANKFFDTLAAGRPIAINHGGWQAELIKKHDIGIILPASEPKQAARAMSAALADRQWLGSAGTRARKLAAQQFDRAILAEQFGEVIARTVGGTP